jgi:hypothetical protein
VTISPKYLSFDEMWKLYKIIDFKPTSEKEFFVDSLLEIMKTMDGNKFVSVVDMFYPESKKENGLIMAERFSSGMRSNDFFSFYAFIKGLSHG